jgi:hypothetical protein
MHYLAVLQANAPSELSKCRRKHFTFEEKVFKTPPKLFPQKSEKLDEKLGIFLCGLILL